MASDNIAIRQAKPDDIDSIVAFQQNMALETEGKSLDVDLLRRGVNAVFESNGEKGFYLIADVDGNPPAACS